MTLTPRSTNSPKAESKGGHILHDSKLTRILQPALGNSKTAIVCAMTPAHSYREESHSTLKFANALSALPANKATVNEVAANTPTRC